MKRIAILGSALSGGAAQIIEAMNGNLDLTPEFILDSDPNAIDGNVYGVKIIGSTNKVIDLWNKKLFDAAVVAIGGNLKERNILFKKLKENKIETINIIDQSVKFGFNVSIGSGNVILNSTYLGNNVQLGDNNYILNQCSVQHDSKIGNSNYFATNVTIGAKVKIGNENRFKIKSIVETSVCIDNFSTLESGEIKSL